MTTPGRTASARAPGPGWARFAGRRATGVLDHVDVTQHPEALAEGFWAVVGDFEGRVLAWRFAEVEEAVEDAGASEPAGAAWRGPDPHTWQSSLDRAAYCAGVEAIRAEIREGEVYQVNLCRVLAAPLSADGEPDASALAAVLAAGNPAPYAGVVHVPAGAGVPPVWVVTASPELYLRVADGWVASGPIKGTAATAGGLTGKDAAENVMIADMVRNDLQRVCSPGTVEVTDLLALEQHPGLVHLVTTVRGRLVDPRPDWAAVLGATYPPASVSGAPKLAALRVIDRLEPVRRGPYCGAIGWVQDGRAELAVGIRTFWWTAQDGGTLRFGTGAGITWESDAAAEWAETELKAARLVALASGAPPGRPEPTVEDDH